MLLIIVSNFSAVAVHIWRLLSLHGRWIILSENTHHER